jgi:uncharacterized protein (TIGR03083 family)
MDSRYEAYCAAAEAEAAKVLELVGTADPQLPVPTCPGWTAEKLVKHHGTTHRWMAYVIRNRVTERVWARDVPRQLPDDPAAYPDWLAESAELSLAAMREADPDTPMWTIGLDQHVRFWPRRLLYETAVHRADLELALGRTPVIDAGAAVDGIDELLDLIGCFTELRDRVRALGREGETLHLHATDADGEWLITLDGGCYTWQRGHAKGDVAVRGPAGDLLLLAYGRLSPESFDVYGDRDLLAGWISATAL